ncbi:MAG TPA: hypothetical protein VFN95_14370, partial [Flavitalea sp.]|nr:hypothetical protein [Flavitalea sp.]
MVRNIVTLMLVFGGVLASNAQKLAAFEVELPKSTNGLDVPTSVNLDQVSFVADSLLALVEV